MLWNTASTELTNHSAYSVWMIKIIILLINICRSKGVKKVAEYRQQSDLVCLSCIDTKSTKSCSLKLAQEQLEGKGS